MASVLGIETSCDETGIAIYDGFRGLRASFLHTQVDMHAKYGGVVPELASRDHVTHIVPLIHSALAKAQMSLQDLSAIAYTEGPGLLGALLVGSCVGQSLAFALNIPAVGVHHMEGHLLAPFLEDDKPSYPFLALLVSGGHTLLVHVRALGVYEVLGESVDDAAGEAFDKTATLLNLPYPGGPKLAALAALGHPEAYVLPKPLCDRPGLNFSFSGLKTAVLQLTRTLNMTEDTVKADVAASFQKAVVDTLFIKCERALKQTGLTQLVVAGGVSANHALRARLKSLGVQLYFPRPEFCTDNGAMIAYAGWLRFKNGERHSNVIHPRARWPLASLTPPAFL